MSVPLLHFQRQVDLNTASNLCALNRAILFVNADEADHGPFENRRNLLSMPSYPWDWNSYMHESLSKWPIHV